MEKTHQVIADLHKSIYQVFGKEGTSFFSKGVKTFMETCVRCGNKFLNLQKQNNNSCITLKGLRAELSFGWLERSDWLKQQN